MTVRYLVGVGACVLSLLPSWLRAQDARVAVRGRVFNSDSTPVAGARVIATHPGETRADTTATTANGVYHLSLVDGRTYLVRVTAINRTSAEHQISAADGAIVDFYLGRAAVVLQAVHVTSSNRRAPSRQGANPLDAAKQNKGFSDATWMTGSDEFDVAAAAATVPGVSTSTGGFSVLGLPSSENGVLLNGMEVQLATLPRGLGPFASVSLSPTDPSRGGFAGGQVGLITPPGGDVSRRAVHVSTNQTPRVAPNNYSIGYASGIQDYQVSADAEGSLVAQRLYYSASAQGGQQTSRNVAFDALATDDPLALHLAPQTASATLTALRAAGLVPSRDNPWNRSSNLSFFGRSDLIFPSVRFNAVGWGSVRSSNDGISPEASLSSGLGDRSGGAGAQLGMSQYIGSVLHELGLSASEKTNRVSALNSLPAVTIDVASTLDSLVWNSAVQAGGNPLTERFSATSTYAVRDAVAWLAGTNKHRLSVTAGAAVDRDDERLSSAAHGSFVFTSLDNFQLGQPSSYLVGSASRPGPVSTNNAYLSAGDYWQPRPRVRVEFGGRVDAGGLASGFQSSAADLSAVGVTSSTPAATLAFSPRFGFSVDFGRRANSGPQAGDPVGAFRFAFGRYVSNWRPGGFASASLQNANSLGSLTCVGALAPLTDWSRYTGDPAASPEMCSDPNAPLSHSAAVFARAFRPPSSWRGSVGSSRYFANGSRFDLDVVLSRTTSLRSVVDANVGAVPDFQLAAEGNRPVFAPALSIDTSSALTMPSAGRVLPSLDRVLVTSSLGQSKAAAATASFSPLSTTRFAARFAYTASWATDLVSGFDRPTDGDPRRLEWQPSVSIPRHQFLANVTAGFGPSVHLSVFARMSSGTPFTPIADADINGDHAANDRAFVFDPRAVSDSAVRRGMNRLLASASGQCLRGQVGMIAAAASCDAAWSTALNADLELKAPVLHLSDRLSFDLSFFNLAAAADQLIHAQAHGWGAWSSPDPVLLHVVGFDATRSQFRYAVNPGFGRMQTLPGAYSIALHVRLEIGPDPDRQLLNQQLNALASIPGEPDTTRLRNVLTHNVPNFALSLIRIRDSLELSPEQVSAIQRLNAAFQARELEIWSPLLQWLVGRRLEYADDITAKRYKDTKLVAYESAGTLGVELRRVLSPRQFNMISPALRRYFDYDEVVAMRNMY